MSNRDDWRFDHARQRLQTAIRILLPPHQDGIDEDFRAACHELLPSAFDDIDQAALSEGERDWLETITALVPKGMKNNDRLSEEDQRTLSKAIIDLYTHLQTT